MILTSLLVSALIFNTILAYNTIKTIIYCNKLGETIEGTEEFHYYNHFSDKYAKNVKPAMYITMLLYAIYFIVKWVF